MKKKCCPDNVNSELLVFTHIDIMQCKVILLHTSILCSVKLYFKTDSDLKNGG